MQSRVMEMNTMDITREYKRTFGDSLDKKLIKTVKLTVPAGWAMDGKALPDESVTYLANFALQCLQDTYGKAAFTEAEALGAFMTRYDKIIAGTMGTREAGGVKVDADPVRSLAHRNAKAALMARFEKVVPGAKKMSDYVKHPKIAPYFKVKDEKAVWVEQAVSDWMETHLAGGGTDFMAEAKAMLETPVDLDF
jgi:hypothetical protein